MSATLVVLAAGLGSRYGGIKQMEGVGPNGEILLEYALYDAKCAGFNRFVIILRPDIIDDFRERFGARLEETLDIRYAVQDFSSIPAFYSIPAERSKPFGTIHAMLCADEQTEGKYAILNADDFYGRDAFEKMLLALDDIEDEHDACMVAYRLGNTISENGTVTRGVCDVENGALRSIVETHEIGVAPSGEIRGEYGVLSPDTVVSMNLFGFTKASFADMREYFDGFLRALPDGEKKAECLAPTYVGDRVDAGRMRVNVLTTDATWFGMTYAADREFTHQCLLRLHEQGVYPEKLF